MSEQMVRLAGSQPRHDQPLVGASDPHERIEVTLKLRRKTEDGLPTLDEFLQGKRASGVNRRMLGDKYGATSADADAVQAWAGQHKLSVSKIDLKTRTVRLVGAVADIGEAFEVTLKKYRHNRTQTEFRCPDRDASIPQSLSQIVVAVLGLNDMPVVVRHDAKVARKVPTLDAKASYPGSFFPNEVAALYKFPAAKGAGQSIAILEFGGGFDPKVLNAYFKTNIGLATPPAANPISVLGTPMNLTDGAVGEVYLDVEIVGAMAPQAKMDVYFAPWTGEGYLTAIEQAIHNDDYAALSISYGIDEDVKGDTSNPAWPMLNKQVDEAFREAAAIGLPIFVSSGDQGSSSERGYLSNGDEITLYKTQAHAAYPASSPYATAVGGTMLYAANGAISNEVIWNELGQLMQRQFYLGGATGGGVSDRYSAPSYQTNAGVKLSSANHPSKAGRCVPDVAGNSGATTGYLVSEPNGASISIVPVGGTSAAAPMWAALAAVTREALTTTLGKAPPAFFFNDFVYAKGNTNAFRPIEGGRSLTYDAQGQPQLGGFTPKGNNRSSEADGYYGAGGYNLCCGWGSPNGEALVAQLQDWLKAQGKI